MTSFNFSTEVQDFLDEMTREYCITIFLPALDQAVNDAFWGDDCREASALAVIEEDTWADICREYHVPAGICQWEWQGSVTIDADAEAEFVESTWDSLHCLLGYADNGLDTILSDGDWLSEYVRSAARMLGNTADRAVWDALNVREDNISDRISCLTEVACGYGIDMGVGYFDEDDYIISLIEQELPAVIDQITATAE